MTEYTFSIKNFLSDEERHQLYESNIDVLKQLGKEYCPQLDLENDLPITPVYFDYLRASWMLDKNLNKQPQQLVLTAIGFAFGYVLEKGLGLKWALIEDNYGEVISLVKSQADPSLYNDISVPPFSFVEKRSESMNAEVLEAGFNEISDMIGETIT